VENDPGSPPLQRIPLTFDAQAAYEDLRNGLVVGLLSFGFALLFGSFVVTQFRSTNPILLLVFGGMTLIFILQGLLSIRVIREGISVLATRWVWFKKAAQTYFILVEKRQTKVEASDEHGQVYFQDVYYFDLEFNEPEQVGGKFGKVVSAIVSERLYRKYQVHDRLKVYYEIDSPLTMQFAGE
jgi:hypothetical protein